MPAFPTPADLPALGTLTRYPSIPTHLPLEKGRLREDQGDQFGDHPGPIVLTEKVDGTNARITVPPGEAGDPGRVRYLIGSRSEWLTAAGDLVANPAMGIVGAVRDIADRLAAKPHPTALLTYYGEVYGGSINGAGKQYAGTGAVGFRLFDVARCEDYRERLTLPPEELSAWREGGGPAFLTEDELAGTAARFDLPLTPRLGEVDGLPGTLADGLALLEQFVPETRAALDDTAAGSPEGVVARTRDRRGITKLRLADYRKAAGLGKKGGGGR